MSSEFFIVSADGFEPDGIAIVRPKHKRVVRGKIRLMTREEIRERDKLFFEKEKLCQDS